MTNHEKVIEVMKLWKQFKNQYGVGPERVLYANIIWLWPDYLREAGIIK